MKCNVLTMNVLLLLSVTHVFAARNLDLINKSYLSMLQPSISETENKYSREDVKKILYLCDAIDHASSAKSLLCQLDEVGYMKTAVDARIHTILLISVLERTVFFTKLALLRNIDIIEQHIVYWRTQGNHSIHYFFNKSPVKIVSGPEQSKEIKVNVRHLEHLQKKYCALLGELNQQYHRFDSTATVEKQFSWLCETTDMMSRLPFINSKHNAAPDLVGVVNPIRTILKRLGRHEVSVRSAIGDAKIPGYFTVKNSLIAIGSCALAYSYLNNQDYYHGLLQSAKTGCETFYHTNMKDPLERGYAALFAYKEGEGLAYVQRRIDQIHNQIAPEPMTDEQKTAFVESYVNIVKPFYATPQEWIGVEEEVRSCAEQFNPKYLRLIMTQVAGSLHTKSNWAVLWGGDSSVRSITFLVSIATLFADIIWGTAGKVGADPLLAGDITNIISYFQRITDQLQLTVACLAMVPTALIGVGAWKAVKKIYEVLLKTTAYDFRQTRFVLHDLHKLLAENADKYMGQIDYVAQGKLLFYVYKLKQDVRTYMRFDQSGRFMEDINALASLKISNYQKIEIIHGIWNTFTVIRPGYKP